METPATLIHPTAILSSNGEVGAGSYIGYIWPRSVTSVNTKIGAHAIVDTHVSIGHDADLKDFFVPCTQVPEYLVAAAWVGTQLSVQTQHCCPGRSLARIRCRSKLTRELFNRTRYDSPGRACADHLS
jgi:hypothetical protein